MNAGYILWKEGDTLSLISQKYPWSKWYKHVCLQKEPLLEKYLPDTMPLAQSHLLTFLQKYPNVYVKPCCGGGGRGVIKVMRIENRCIIQTTRKRFAVPYESVYRYVKPLTRGKRYIVQQGIDLVSISNRPIDFRVLLLRPKQEWELMGIMGKLAVRNQIVTNHCRGGSSISYKQAMQRATGWKDEEYEKVEKEMVEASQLVANTLQSKYKYMNQLGLDMAVDSQKHIWLIEANTKPQYNLFKDHDNPMLYKEIHHMIRRLRKPTVNRLIEPFSGIRPLRPAASQGRTPNQKR